MADRQAFARVQQAATCIMAGLYIAFGAIVYAVQGRAATELAVFAADDLHALGRAVVVCVLLQTFVQLSLSVYLWTATFLRLCAAGKEPATLPMAQLPHVQVYPAVAANACSLHTRGDSAASMACAIHCRVKDIYDLCARLSLEARVQVPYEPEYLHMLVSALPTWLPTRYVQRCSREIAVPV
jgi:hypothetical protein